MTVRELIAELQKQDGDLEVWSYDDISGPYPAKAVHRVEAKEQTGKDAVVTII